MAKDRELESHTAQAKDYIARHEAIKAKYPNAKTWEELSEDVVEESLELRGCEWICRLKRCFDRVSLL